MRLPRAFTGASVALSTILFSTACSRSEAGSTPMPSASATINRTELKPGQKVEPKLVL